MKLLPIHPHPFPDETLSSYIYRLTEANSLSTFAILKACGYTRENQPNSIGYNVNTNSMQHHIDAISNLTGFPVNVFKRMTIQRYKVLSTERNASLWERSNNFWFDATDIKICPYCLSENTYYRIYWKLLVVCACLKHKVLLTDRCQHCGWMIKDVVPSCNYILPVGVCSSCGKQLSRSNSLNIKLDEHGILSQQNFFEIFEGSGLNHKVGGIKQSNLKMIQTSRLIYSLMVRLNPLDLPLIHTVPVKIMQIAVSDFEKLKPIFKNARSVYLNYVIFTSIYGVLSQWPRAFYQLLDKLYQLQAPFEGKTRNRVFGLTQKTHLMLTTAHLPIIVQAYREWIRSRFKTCIYFSKRDFLLDSRLRSYFLGGKNLQNEIQNYIETVSKIVTHFSSHRQHIDDALKAIVYKIKNGCPWSRVPLVKHKVLNLSRIYKVIWNLKNLTKQVKVKQ